MLVIKKVECIFFSFMIWNFSTLPEANAFVQYKFVGGKLFSFPSQQLSIRPVFHDNKKRQTHGKIIIKPLGSSYYTSLPSQNQEKIIKNNTNNIFRAFKKEASLTWNLIKGNTLAHIGLGLICITANAVFTGLYSKPIAFASVLLKGFAWFFGYGYFFDICDQLQGKEGDARNAKGVESKQSRPLATGDMSVMGGFFRYGICAAYFLASSAVIGGFPLTLCALLWMLVTVNYPWLSSHYLTKNTIAMSMGCVSMLLGSRILCNNGPMMHFPSILISYFMGSIADIQDFRDEYGDRLDGRHTLVVVHGSQLAKKLWAGYIPFISAVVGWLFRSKLSWPVDGTIGLALLAIVINFFRAETIKSLDVAYRNYLLFVGVVFARSAFL